MLRILLRSIAFATLLAAFALPVEGSGEPAELARANARWRGAHCRIRLELELKKGRNDEGWTKSRAYAAMRTVVETPIGNQIGSAAAKGERPFFFIFEVSDRAALAGVMRGDVVPGGTELISEGWFLARPEKNEGPYLELRFAAAPTVKARFWFLLGGSFRSADGYPLARFEPVERYMRVEAFHLDAVDEQLVPAGSAARAPTSPAAATTAAPSSGSTRSPAADSPTYHPALRVVAVACQPARVAPGEEVDLILTYVVEGIPPGASFAVAERRQILEGERPIATFDQPMSRTADTFTSLQRIRIPASAPRGLYTVRGQVEMAGIRASGDALLDIR